MQLRSHEIIFDGLPNIVYGTSQFLMFFVIKSKRLIEVVKVTFSSTTQTEIKGKVLLLPNMLYISLLDT